MGPSKAKRSVNYNGKNSVPCFVRSAAGIGTDRDAHYISGESGYFTFNGGSLGLRY